jgi:hypothetical protein
MAVQFSFVTLSAKGTMSWNYMHVSQLLFPLQSLFCHWLQQYLAANSSLWYLGA